jgi:hypothetical protein
MMDNDQNTVLADPDSSASTDPAQPKTDSPAFPQGHFKTKEAVAEEFEKQTGKNIFIADTILAGVALRNNMMEHGNFGSMDPAMEECPFTQEQLEMIDLYNSFKKKSPYLFHTTRSENLESIIANGLSINAKRRHEGVSGDGKISLAASEQVAAYYGGHYDVMLRVKKSFVFNGLETDLLGGGEGAYATSTDIPVSALEIKVKCKWVSLDQYKPQLTTSNPDTPFEPGQTHIKVDGKDRPIHNSNGELLYPTKEGIHEFWMWFGDSVAVDDEGRPIRVYRGEHGKDDQLSTRLGSWSFGSKEIAAHYAANPNDKSADHSAINPKVFSAYLKITRPLIKTPNDPFIDLTVVWDVLGKEVAIRVARENAKAIIEMDGWHSDFEDTYGDGEDVIDQLISKEPDRVKDLYVYAFSFFDNPELINLAKEAGFDGAIHAEYGFHSTDWSHAEFKIFDLDQIRLVADQNNPSAAQGSTTEPIEEEPGDGPSL